MKKLILLLSIAFLTVKVNAQDMFAEVVFEKGDTVRQLVNISTHEAYMRTATVVPNNPVAMINAPSGYFGMMFIAENRTTLILNVNGSVTDQNGNPYAPIKRGDCCNSSTEQPTDGGTEAETTDPLEQFGNKWSFSKDFDGNVSVINSLSYEKQLEMLKELLYLLDRMPEFYALSANLNTLSKAKAETELYDFIINELVKTDEAVNGK